MNCSKETKPNVLAIIPARGGSKSIPRKNVKPFFGKPLIQWTIEAALNSSAVKRTIVSTDDREIAEISISLGAEVPFLRPPELASDTANTPDAIKHSLKWLQQNEGASYDWIIVLEPTAPARTTDIIDSAIELLTRTGADSVSAISAIPHHHCHEKALVLKDNSCITGISGTPIPQMKHRRQGIDSTFGFNGLIWACKSMLLESTPPSLWGKKNLGFVTDERFCIDLDTPWDWEIGQSQMQILRHKKLL